MVAERLGAAVLPDFTVIGDRLVQRVIRCRRLGSDRTSDFGRDGRS
jgi:hypothetical protein